VESFGWFEDEKNVYISMEYLQHGDLRNVLNAAALSEEETQIVARQLVEGLELMHSNHFVHRDLKPAVGHAWNSRSTQHVRRRC
jgi:serine/threonine protein kinase